LPFLTSRGLGNSLVTLGLFLFLVLLLCSWSWSGEFGLDYITGFAALSSIYQ